MLKNCVVLLALASMAGLTTADVELKVETIEAESILGLDEGAITQTRTVLLTGEHRFIYSYLDPNSNKSYEIVFDFDVEPDSTRDELRLDLFWVEEENPDVELRRRNLAVDGSLTVSVYQRPGEGEELFLRLTPRRVKGERASGASRGR